MEACATMDVSKEHRAQAMIFNFMGDLLGVGLPRAPH
jgi:hypothetical protein